MKRGPSPPRVPERIRRFLRDHETFYLVGHVEPDGDCLAASLALGEYLVECGGKRVRQYNAGPFDRREVMRFARKFSPRIAPSARRSDPDPAVVILDCSEPERVGEILPDLEGLPSAVIDHHHSGKPFGDVRFLDTSAAATSYLVQLVIESLGGPVTREVAQLLLFGISTDTGYFRHTGPESADLYRAVSRLLVAGASPRIAHQQMFGGHTLQSRQLLGTLLERAEPIADGAALITWETEKDAGRYGRHSRDSDSLYQLLFGVEGVRVVGFIREEEDARITGSLRSIDTIDVSRIAELFGGGGHKRAAGFVTKLTLREVRGRLEAEFLAALREDSGAGHAGSTRLRNQS